MRLVSWTVLAALGVASLAGAQSTPQIAAEPASSSVANTSDPAIAAVVSAAMPKFSTGGTVRGVPFSATQTTVHEQSLADGTIITVWYANLFGKFHINVFRWRPEQI